ncbi:hypothetical protein DRN43_00520 [Thermococci archaeon]|nr:MAG: hypothetical protein DRN43_00520 [Thermococci archaeon]
MAAKVKNSEGVKLLINEVAKAVGVSPKELIGYYEWKANLKKLKTKKISKKEALEFLKSQEGKRKISEEEAVRIYYEAKEEVRRWREIERKLKKLGLE